MKIALDYDHTYTLDPEFWDDFIFEAKDRGHLVTIVTSRSKNEPIEHKIACHVIYCNYQAKEEFYKPDIWIDDDPKWITERIYRR